MAGSSPQREEAWLAAVHALHTWMRERDYAGPDPQDALASPLLSRLSFGSRWLGVAWTQLGKRTPPALRRLAGAAPARNPKGIGLIVAACERLERVERTGRWRAEAERLIDWLDEVAVRSDDTAAWGYPFPWANRDFFAPAHTPSGVATAFVAHALLDCAAAWRHERAATLAVAAARFVQRRLNRVPMAGGFAFSYTPLDERVVHNANVLSASLLARAGVAIGDRTMVEAALTAARATSLAQAADGSWAYGQGRRNRWIDSFHTGYLLVALETIRSTLGAHELEQPIARGTAYWRACFFAGPAVGFAPRRPYPIEQHAVAHAIIAARVLQKRLPEAQTLAARLGAWSLAHMRAPDGSFYYRRWRWRTSRARYMRWTQAWMLLALAELAAWQAP